VQKSDPQLTNGSGSATNVSRSTSVLNFYVSWNLTKFMTASNALPKHSLAHRFRSTPYWQISITALSQIGSRVIISLALVYTKWLNSNTELFQQFSANSYL